MRNILLGFGVPLLLLFAIQLVPYGREHAKPAAGRGVAWDSPATLALARRACFDCHSNETRWPWYASVAPISWRIQTDVNLARKKLDFTAFDERDERMAKAAARAGETVLRGDMPPQDYIMVHSEARLNAADKRALAAGLDSTFAVFVRVEKERGRLP
jgi:mono/diheme cytochrome c family protein